MQNTEGNSKNQAATPGASPLAPSVTLPLRFIITSLSALTLGVTLLFLRPEVLTNYHYNQHVIAITHLFVLGWICTVVMGSVYQLVPVALEARLYSEKLAAVQFILHVIGVAGMVWMFWRWDMKQVGHFGSVFAVGVALFVYNIFRTLLRVPKWNVVASAVSSTLFWLACTVLFGLAIATGKCSYEAATNPQSQGALVSMLRVMAGFAAFMARFDPIGAMHAHAHIGAVGIFLVLIVGVSYRLVPMFTLSELQSRRRAMLSIVLLNAGLAATFFSVLLRSQYKPYSAAIIGGGLLLYALEIRAILRERKRRHLDWGLIYFLTGVGLLGLVLLMGLTLSWPSLPLTAFTGQLEMVYALLGLLGAVSLAIIGMLYKIIPFIVWYSCYSKQIGLRKVPSLADLYSERVQKAGYWLFLGGLGITSSGTLLGNTLIARAGCLIFGLAVGSLLLNVATMFGHYVRPRLQPLQSKKVVKTSFTSLATNAAQEHLHS